MAIAIGSGINVGPGITITSGGSPILNLLSPAGQAAWTAAATDSWINVSSADWANVKAGLSGVSTIGYSDAQLTGSGSSFSRNFGATLDFANATVINNNYILGLASRGAGSGTIIFRPYVGPSFRVTYGFIGSNSLTMSATSVPTYWLRKNPPTAASGALYPAVGPAIGGTTLNWFGTGTWGSGATGGAYSSNMLINGWTNFNTNLPAQQWLLTNVVQW